MLTSNPAMRDLDPPYRSSRRKFRQQPIGTSKAKVSQSCCKRIRKELTFWFGTIG
jgi:hypothetical protein